VQLEKSTYEFEYEGLRNQVKEKEILHQKLLGDLDRADKLRSQITVSAYDNIVSNVAASNSAIKQLKAKEDSAKYFLAYTTVASPIAGRVGLIRKNVGAYVAQNELLTQVTDDSRVYIDFSVPEPMYRKSEALVGDALAQVREISINGMKYRDVLINFGSMSINRDTGDFLIRVELPNEAHQLIDGEYVDATFTFKLKKHVAVVPKKVTFMKEHDVCVYKYASGGIAKEACFKPLHESVDEYLIPQDFFTQGDLIITDKLTYIEDGRKVAKN
jgi:RND family efflux transporter MFP subunit